MRRQLATTVLIFPFSVLIAVATTSAGKPYSHHQRTCNQCCIPKGNYGHDTPQFGATAFAVANAPNGKGELERKTFQFRATALRIDHLQLDQVGLAIYRSEGTLVATGRIAHDGGDGGLIGSNVTIRLRAYAASQADPVRIPPDAPVVWESQRELWISRDRPEHISLSAPPNQLPHPAELTKHFDEITHLEVELLYKRDR